ncbi:MAG: hypothetical protein QOH72_243, partial [Solirubrobacteraceae bacterium]|nr:hypothetical protein [Solirubrobacteraceae bacterium]
MQVRSVVPGRATAGCLLAALAMSACGGNATKKSAAPAQPQRMS